MRNFWVWLRRERFSWLELAYIVLLMAVVQTVQDALSWPSWLALAVALGGSAVAVCVIAAIHGAWKGLRG